MPPLHPATLFFASSVAFAVVASVMVYYYKTQRTYAGFGDWLAGAAGIAAMLFGFFALGGEGRAHPLPNLVVNVLVVAGADRLYRGTARFGGESPRVRAADLVVYAPALAAYAWWVSVVPDAPRRVAVVTGCLAFAALRTSLAARRLARGPYRANGLLLASATAALAFLMLAHTAITLAGAQPEPSDVVRRTPLAVVLLAVSIGTGVLAALAFMMLNTRRTTAELEAALGQVKQLEGIIPICMYCKKVREDPASWTRIEKYVSEHSNAQFSHGMCPECYAREHGEAP